MQPTADYLRFQQDLSATLVEVLARDAHYDVLFERNVDAQRRPEWRVFNKKNTTEMPYVSLSVTEISGRESVIVTLLTFGAIRPSTTENVPSRSIADIRAAIDRLRGGIGLSPLF